MVEDSDNNALQEWSTKNLDLMYFIEFSGNKLSFILGSIPIFGITTNQVGHLSISPNNNDTGKNSGENAVTVNYAIENKGTGESNRNIKVDLKV